MGLAIYPTSLRPTVVEQLGMFDNFGEILEPHIVGLWKVEGTCFYSNSFITCIAHGDLVASSVFMPGDDAFRAGGYRFHSIPPVQLERSRTYIVATHYSHHSPDPITYAPPSFGSYQEIAIVYGVGSMPVTNAFVGPSRVIYADERHFASGNLIFSTNPPPVARMALHRTPHRIGDTISPWLVSTNDQPVALVLDARQSSDPENEPLNYQWLLSGQTPTPVGEGAVFTNYFPVGQNFGLILRVSDGLQYVDDYGLFQTHSPRSAMDAMRDMVRASNAGRNLKVRLLASLRNADAFFRRHRSDRALARQQTLEVRVTERLQGLDQDSAGRLLDAVEAIREAFQGETLLKR